MYIKIICINEYLIIMNLIRYIYLPLKYLGNSFIIFIFVIRGLILF